MCSSLKEKNTKFLKKYVTAGTNFLLFFGNIAKTCNDVYVI